MRRARSTAFELAKVEPVIATWVTPYTLDPFTIGPAEKAALLLEATAAALGVAGVTHAEAGIVSVREDKLLVTSEGSRIHQVHLRIAPELTATAVDRRRG